MGRGSVRNTAVTCVCRKRQQTRQRIDCDCDYCCLRGDVKAGATTAVRKKVIHCALANDNLNPVTSTSSYSYLFTRKVVQTRFAVHLSH